jgi:hypothetical protein
LQVLVEGAFLHALVARYSSCSLKANACYTDLFRRTFTQGPDRLRGPAPLTASDTLKSIPSALLCSALLCSALLA